MDWTWVVVVYACVWTVNIPTPVDLFCGDAPLFYPAAHGLVCDIVMFAGFFDGHVGDRLRVHMSTLTADRSIG